MSVYFYDEAIVNSLKSITGDNRINIQPYDRVFSNIARDNEDVIELPLITLSRTGWSIIGERKSHFAKFEGALVKIEDPPTEEDELKLYRLQAIPIRISYVLDVWTKDRVDNDNILRELIFYYETHPELRVRIPYGLDIDHVFNIFIDPDIEDNSDISDQINHGEYFRQTLSIYTDDAYLWKASSRGPTIIDPNFISVVQDSSV